MSGLLIVYVLLTAIVALFCLMAFIVAAGAWHEERYTRSAQRNAADALKALGAMLASPLWPLAAVVGVVVLIWSLVRDAKGVA